MTDMSLTRTQCLSIIECGNKFNIKHFFKCKVCGQIFCTTIALLMHKNDNCKELFGNSDKGASKDGGKDTVFTPETLDKVIKELKLDVIFPVKKKAKMEPIPSTSNAHTTLNKTDTVFEPTLQKNSNGNKKALKTRKQRNKMLKQSQSMKQDKLMDVEFEPIPSTSNAHTTLNKNVKVTEGQLKPETNKPEITISLPEAYTKETFNEYFRSDAVQIMHKDSAENKLLADLFNKKLITWTEEELDEDCQSILKYMTKEGGEGNFDKKLEGSKFVEDIKNACVISCSGNSIPKTGNENTTINPENSVKGKTCKKKLNKSTQKGGKKNKK